MQGRGLGRHPSPALFDNECDHAFEIVAHVQSSNPNGLDALRGQPLVTSLVAARIGAQLVREAIHLEAESGLVAEEIQGVSAMRMLPAKLEAAGTNAEHVPETPLRRRHFFAQLRARSVPKSRT
jgi:hypothetical protein